MFNDLRCGSLETMHVGVTLHTEDEMLRPARPAHATLALTRLVPVALATSLVPVGFGLRAHEQPSRRAIAGLVESAGLDLVEQDCAG